MSTRPQIRISQNGQHDGFAIRPLNNHANDRLNFAASPTNARTAAIQPLWPQPDLSTRAIFAHREELLDARHNKRFAGLVAHAERQLQNGRCEVSERAIPRLIQAYEVMAENRWGNGSSHTSELMGRLPYYSQLALLHVANDNLPEALRYWAIIEKAQPDIERHAAIRGSRTPVPELTMFNQLRELFSPTPLQPAPRPPLPEALSVS